MTGTLWLAAFLTLPVAGWALLSHPAFARWPVPTRLVLSGAAGAALMSLLMTASALAGWRWRTGALVLATAALAALLRRFVRDDASNAASSVAPHGPGGLPAALAHGSAGIAVALALVAAFSGTASSPDLLFFWGSKAQHFARLRTIDPEFLRQAGHQFMHPSYPPLVPNLYAFATMAAGRLPWTAAILTFPLLLGALAFALPGLLAPHGRSRGAAVSALTVAALGLAGMSADVGGNAEMPLLVFEGLAAALLLSPSASARGTEMLAGVLLSGAAAAKVEGLPFALAAAVLAIGARRPRSGVGPSLARLLGPTAVVLATWFGFGASRGLFLGYSEGPLDFHAGQLAAVAQSVGERLLATGGGLPWLVPAACLLAAIPLGRRALVPLGTAAALTAFFLLAYARGAEPPALWISWSAARIFMPVAMLLALAPAAAYADASAPGPRTPPATRD